MAHTKRPKGGGVKDLPDAYSALTGGSGRVVGCNAVVLDGELAVPCTRNPL